MASPSCDFGDSVRILKIPCQALGRSAVFRLGNQFDIVTARDLATLETATVIRTANRTISNWKALAVELEKDFGMLGSLKALDGREGRLWHSPDHWKMPLLSQRLAEGARYESKTLQDYCISAVNLIREIERKPQREIYRSVFHASTMKILLALSAGLELDICLYRPFVRSIASIPPGSNSCWRHWILLCRIFQLRPF